ncbi:N-acetylmuramoyl-L-alanine amidase [Flavimobilis sp. GY10621]|uniref:N-acetylmuramoyl-L-alanine amidase n=1 Tax=Flavimobilis rhizosphaerae TaxID=2775421 RepID=A0ABR9DRA3_9MICO|nr:N-acetylmuramoyl-L-alanine amidase [Flavimobilis rhizosphaerae]MBD9699645.1 N-acetylmuramoyl-L-alanine amidase [Flavimobilis rhizosphaerae]
MRRLVSAATVAALTVAGLALPVVSMPVAAATPVTPEVVSMTIDGVDARAAAQPGALDAPPEVRTDAATERAVALEDALAPTPVEAVPELVPLASATDPDLAALTPLTRTERFTAVGVTWDAASAEEVLEVTVRIREGGAWSEWVALPESEAVATSDRAGTEPLVSAGADGVQARVRTASGNEPAGVRLDLVDAGSSPADASIGGPGALATASAATASVLRPRVVTRAEWGADEKLRRAWTPQDQSSRLAAMYVHHTVNRNDYARKDAAKLVRSVYAYHTQSMKWPDIGYQFLVDRFGTLYEGRYGAIDTLPIGAQAGGYNTTTIGVSAIGNFENRDDNKNGKVDGPSKAMLESIAQLLAWKAYEHGLDPRGKAKLYTGTSTKSGVHAKPGETITVNVIQGHRDTNITACPGKTLYAKLGSIRTLVDALVDVAVAAHGAAQPVLPAPVPDAHTAQQSPAQLTTQQVYTWQPVAGAVGYELLERPASHGNAFADARGWRTIATVKNPRATLTVSPGVNRLVVVRAVSATGERGAMTDLVRATRPVSQSALTFSASWKKQPSDGAVDGALRATTGKGATLKVSSVRDARRIVLVGEEGPGNGRVSVSVGSIVVGEVSWAADALASAAVRVVDLPAAVSGTVTVRTLDSGTRVALTSLAFPRWESTGTAPGDGGGPGGPTGPAPTPTPPPAPAAPATPKLRAPGATVAPVRLSSTATLRWSAAPRATSYEVHVRTASHGGKLGAWRVAKRTTSRAYTLKLGYGRTAEVGIVAVGDGGRSARAVFPKITRHVSPGTVQRSTGAARWKTVRDARYLRGVAWTTSAKSARLRVKKSKDVRTIQVTAASGRGHGRFAVYAGSKRVATFSTASSRTKHLVRYTVKLSKPFSGTVTVKTLDRRPVRVSAVTTAR